MITLVEPCERYLQSYIEAHDEYEIHGVETYAFDNARAYYIFEKYDNHPKIHESAIISASWWKPWRGFEVHRKEEK